MKSKSSMKRRMDPIPKPQARFNAWFFSATASVVAALSLWLASPAASLGAVPSFDGGIVLKNGDAEYSEGGAWEAGKNRGNYYLYGMDYTEARKTTSAGSWALWKPDLTAGTYRVYLWHLVWSAKGDVTIEIKHNAGSTLLKRKAGDGHSGWNSLGDYHFAAGTDGYVKVTLDGQGTLYANAVKFLPADKVDQTTFPPYPPPDGSTPCVDNGNLLVCGQPRLILYGQSLQETMSRQARCGSRTYRSTNWRSEDQYNPEEDMTMSHDEPGVNSLVRSMTRGVER